ncbi:MAG: Spore germination protein [candidate division TM6 bacterium GW2011_GWF2_28_16]|nr:MAG: Spore germination protein [candidate division TM6 bacterium GW2011_GWF2_28_16]
MSTVHKMSKLTAILVTMNIMIGVGIYMVPVSTSKLSGNLSFLCWPLIATIFLPVVYSIAQITKFFTEQGNFYNYAKQELGKGYGFISGWAYFLGFAAISSLLFLKLKELILFKLNLNLARSQDLVFNIVLISIFLFLNLLSLKYVSKIQNITTIIKLLPLFFVILLLFFYFNPGLNFNMQNLSTLQFTIPLAIFGFLGFEAACSISHLIEGDKNTPSKVILMSFIGTAVIYTIFHFSLLNIMGAESLVKYDSLSFINFLGINNPIFLKLLSSFFSAAIFITYISSLFGCILADSSNLHSILENNLLPKSNILKKVNRENRPKHAIFLTGLVIFILISFANNLTLLSALCNFGIVTTYIITLLSLLSIQVKKSLKLGVFITILALISSCIIITYSWFAIGQNSTERLANALPFIVLALIGFALFKINEKYKIN